VDRVALPPGGDISDLPAVIRRIRYLFTGIVQGVGFRPFIYRTARKYDLAGWVQNRADGVYAELEGSDNHLTAFLDEVKTTPPPLAEVSLAQAVEMTPTGDREFRILESEGGAKRKVHIAPDIAVCDDCLAELFDPADRRHRYPFINCTNCGPRLTIINDIPYDRSRTSMACFPMCPVCQGEFDDPGNRRFHAEPNACPVCGPTLQLLDGEGRLIPDVDPLRETVNALKGGAIVAIKGLGGFHLAVDAASDDGVQRLRARKLREEKPFAVMVKNIATAKSLAQVSQEEERLLLTPQRPIVLLRKNDHSTLAASVAPGVDTFGIMLPYTPLHHLLMRKGFTALVMTSANKSDEPICITNREAVSRLQGIADFFLIHNRDILVRCDDGIAAVYADMPTLFRRSRGLAPKPLFLKEPLPGVLALGAQLKGVLCLVKENMAFLSPHIGDLETPLARDFFHETMALLERITECRPDIIACDLHPDYYATQAAHRMNDKTIVSVQHHHAHIISCLAENRETGAVLGLAMDGTGLGTDGRIWGGEFLLADEVDFARPGHLKYFLLPTGETAIHHPWRTATSLLKEAYDTSWEDWAGRLDLIPEGFSPDLMDRILRQRINSPETSSLGRLFDGVAAILGLRKNSVNFEGQAAMELETLSRKGREEILPYEIEPADGVFILDMFPAIRILTENFLAGKAVEDLAAAFHATLIVAFTDMSLRINSAAGIDRVALSGGCFQNRILYEGCISALQRAGFQVLRHRLVPNNDGCIALGQAVVAGYRMKKERSL
jgi:hydrogenase maturation protein HypF